MVNRGWYSLFVAADCFIYCDIDRYSSLTVRRGEPCFCFLRERFLGACLPPLLASASYVQNNSMPTCSSAGSARGIEKGVP